MKFSRAIFVRAAETHSIPGDGKIRLEIVGKANVPENAVVVLVGAFSDRSGTLQKA